MVKMLFRMTGFLKDGIFIAFYGNKGKEENRMKGVWDKVNSGLNFLFGIAGVIMVLVASYAVLARNVLLVSTPWSDELLKLWCCESNCPETVFYKKGGLIL